MDRYMICMAKGGSDMPSELHFDAVKYTPIATTADGNVFEVPLARKVALEAQGFIVVADPRPFLPDALH